MIRAKFIPEQNVIKADMLFSRRSYLLCDAERIEIFSTLSLLDELAIVLNYGKRKLKVRETSGGFSDLIQIFESYNFLPSDWFIQVESGGVIEFKPDFIV